MVALGMGMVVVGAHAVVVVEWRGGGGIGDSGGGGCELVVTCHMSCICILINYSINGCD